MEIKNLENIISECVLYSDNITKNPEFYPQEAKMPLKDLMRYPDKRSVNRGPIHENGFLFYRHKKTSTHR